MGRIKTKQIKRITRELMETHGSEFTADFTKNQATVSRLVFTSSKPIRNKIAGYVTRLAKKGREE